MKRAWAAFAAGLLLLGQSLAAPAAAEPYIWSSVKIGGGGYMPAVIFSPVQPGLAYLRSDMGGVYRWDAAAKTFVPLQDGMAESSYFGVESIAADPVDPKAVFAAVGMYHSEPAAILRSFDQGATWQVVPVPFHMGGNEDGRGAGERLAIDPNNTAHLFFGSRYDGLQESLDRGLTWGVSSGFPLKGLGFPTTRWGGRGGVSFVVFDPKSGAPGQGSKTIFVGVADAGPDHLFRSDDGGKTWRAVKGGPGGGFLPMQAKLSADGQLYITYCTSIGPNGVKDGRVFRLNPHDQTWTDITPDKSINRSGGGYLGLAVDARNPATVMVSTVNHWQGGDIIWRSQDRGATWRDIRPQSHRDVSNSPFLLWGASEASFGWWISALSLDPFNSDHAVYATGATIYATEDLGKVDKPGETSLWTPWVEGVEQTAILTLVSPPSGPPLFSGFGDIGGYAHLDLKTSPTAMFQNPTFDNTDGLAFAALKPDIWVRTGVPRKGEAARMALSTDDGKTWTPLLPSYDGSLADRLAKVTISADGDAIIASNLKPLVSHDRGRTWSPIKGLPASLLPTPSAHDPKTFYAVDAQGGQLLISRDGGDSFAAAPTSGLPLDLSADRGRGREDNPRLLAPAGPDETLWYISSAGLFRSRDGGHRFEQVKSDIEVRALGFGKPAPGKTHPALFAIGRKAGLIAIWRSTDDGNSWIRVNDAQHEYGRRFRCISGDPRVFGRVYVGTDGRGIVYGEPAAQ